MDCVKEHLNSRHGHGINGLINHRAHAARGGVMVYGRSGQGVRRYGPCLDLDHPAGIRHEHELFDIPTPPAR